MDSVVVVESGWRRAWLCVGNPVAQCDVSEEITLDVYRDHEGHSDDGIARLIQVRVNQGLHIDVRESVSFELGLEPVRLDFEWDLTVLEPVLSPAHYISTSEFVDP